MIFAPHLSAGYSHGLDTLPGRKAQELITNGVPLYSQHFTLSYHTFSFTGFMKALLNAICLLYVVKEIVLYVMYHYPYNKLVFELFLTISVAALRQG